MRRSGNEIARKIGWRNAFLVLLPLTVLHHRFFLDLLFYWPTSTKLYFILISVLSGYVIFSRRETLLNVTSSPSRMLGVPIILMSCFSLAAGTHASIETLVYLSLLGNTTGLVIIFLGVGILRQILGPLILMAFALPLPEIIFGRFSMLFQLITAKVAAALLSLYGYSVHLSGSFITLPGIRLEVADVCSGINHVIALTVLSILAGIFFLKKAGSRLFLGLLGPGLGILSNAFRVSLIGVWLSRNPTSNVHGPLNILIISNFVMITGLAGITIIVTVLRAIERKGNV